jgi:hypothetical protein
MISAACGVIILSTPFVMWWLRNHFSLEAKLEKLQIRHEAQKQRNWFIDTRLIPFIASVTEQWLLTKLPPILVGQKAFAWSKYWGILHDKVRKAVTSKFESENIDVVEYLSDRTLTDIINRVVTRTVADTPYSVISILPDEYRDVFSEQFLSFVVQYGESLVDAS